MNDWTRRTLIGTGLLIGGGAFAARAHGATTKSEKPIMSNAARIDTHQHLLPPEFLAALDRHGMSAWAPQKWSAEGAIAMMDEHQIATGVLSLSTPGPHLGDDAEARTLARQVNERIAALVQGRPDRFGMFACVPLPDIDGTIAEIGHAYDHLSPDGVVLLANNKGVYVGDPSFDPVMEELNRRHAVVFIHPGPIPGGPPVKGIHPSLADFLLDTTRAAINMVQHGIMRRFPNLRIVLSHGGGFLPYAAYRIANLSNVISGTDSDAMLDDLSSFYFDTALTSSPTALPSLLAFAKPGHVTFGSDWPYCPNKTVSFFADQLDAYPGLDAAGRVAINRGNAGKLFPRLARKSASSARDPETQAAD